MFDEYLGQSFLMCTKSYLSTSYHTRSYHFRSDHIILDPTVSLRSVVVLLSIISCHIVSYHHIISCYVSSYWTTMSHIIRHHKFLHHIKVLLNDVVKLQVTFTSKTMLIALYDTWELITKALWLFVSIFHCLLLLTWEAWEQKGSGIGSHRQRGAEGLPFKSSCTKPSNAQEQKLSPVCANRNTFNFWIAHLMFSEPVMLKAARCSRPLAHVLSTCNGWLSWCLYPSESELWIGSPFPKWDAANPDLSMSDLSVHHMLGRSLLLAWKE